MSDIRLLADVGGTNARFALQAGPDAPITGIAVLACADFTHIDDAIAAFLARADCEPPRQAAIAIANPVVGDAVSMTNHHWRFSIRALKTRFGLERLLVLNDFTALALALPELPEADLQQVGGGPLVPGAAKALIGPGTGLGVSGLVPCGIGGTNPAWVPLQGEGGHMTLAAADDREAAVLSAMRRRLGHVSAERALSGPGLANLYRAIAELGDRATSAEPPAPAEITQRGLAGDAVCRDALELFCALLGGAAGNLALTLGAQGGVYIGGGIVPRLGDWFTRSAFRQRFEAKGRFEAYLAAIPVFVIRAQTSPALLGAASALGR